MRKPKPQPDDSKLTPVDDVRRIREKLAREAGNDIGLMMQRAEATTRKLHRKLGLKLVKR